MNDKVVKRWVRNLLYEIVLLAAIVGLFIPGRDQDWFIGENQMVKMAIVIKAGIVVPVSIALTAIAYFKTMKTNQMEIIASVIAVPSSGWFWYVTSTYFNSENNWRTDARFLFYIHTILVIEALWFFLKLVLIVLALSLILIIMFWENSLRWRRDKNRNINIKDKILGRDSLNMSVSKIDSEEFWIICMESFNEKEKVIRLPWNQKHFFHSKWISEWITVSPKWPLWNVEIDASMSPQ